ncbi:MAG: hypothetical protein LBL66_04775, partial [Clostridiales bacterium]|nr:hypothetical protein [Clostridiales bacterium]
MGKYGVTIEVAADASKFKQAMKELDGESRAAQKELQLLQEGLKLEFDADKFSRAQQVAQQAIDLTAEKINAVKLRMQALEKEGLENEGVAKEFEKQRLALVGLETQLLKNKKALEDINKIKLDALTKQIDKVADGFNKAAAATKGLSLAAGGALAGLGALGLKTVSAADGIATAAAQLGISAEQLQKFNYIALQTDVDSGQLTKAFVRVRAAVADMAGGIENNASRALAQLNIDFSQFKTADEAFYGVIDALGKMNNDVEMVAAANEIFGDKMANELLPIIRAGGDAVKELGAEYETLGGLSDEQVGKLAEFDNTLNRIKTQIKNIFMQLGSALLPIMETVARFVEEVIVPKLKTLAEFIGGLSTKQMEMGLKALLAVAMLSPLLGMIGKIAGAVSGLAKLLGKGGALTKALDFLKEHPIIAIIAVVAAIVAFLYTTNEQFRESINNLIVTLGEALAPLLGIVTGLLQTIIELLAPIIEIVGNLLANALSILFKALA